MNGDGADPFWSWLKKEQGGVLLDAIKWNFTKFLVNRKGHVVARFVFLLFILFLKYYIVFLKENSYDFYI